MHSTLNGKHVRLRLATPDDARFILDLRLDASRNRFLSPVSDDVEKQRAWLVSYKAREANGEEIYFIIHDEMDIGAVRMYDYRYPSFCWGSWIIKPGAPSYAAIESALLIYEHAFYTLGFTRSHFDVRKGNHRVIAFHERFGASRTGEDDLNCYFEFSKAAYESIRPRYVKFLTGSISAASPPSAHRASSPQQSQDRQAHP